MLIIYFNYFNYKNDTKWKSSHNAVYFVYFAFPPVSIGMPFFLSNFPFIDNHAISFMYFQLVFRKIENFYPFLFTKTKFSILFILHDG